MSDARRERLKDLLHQAMALSPDEQAFFIDKACSSDNDLRLELQGLLAVNAKIPPGFLKSLPPDKKLVAEAMSTYGTLAAGQIFAEHFRLERKLGEGGMGQVWLAEQLSPVQRRVALKLIRAGIYDESVMQRFQVERQSLAMMDHPAIAKVFEAGATPQGQPYFVMEYVPGLPLTEYCDQHKLKIRERLELFIQVCDGVQHAHQKAFIHRDLKPANVLVVDVDGKPQPRVIDFGLVKGVGAQVEDQTALSRWGQFLGTPGYMSPEQADRNVQDVDTRTDVYSLGVILYVLLTGLQPFETARLSPPPVDELLRRLREEDPPRPSGKVSGDRSTGKATAIARCIDSSQLVSTLRGDLDWIAMKALERDRARRYGTPSDLAADLRRYLNHEPVTARPASLTYRFGKYIRRHRVAAGVGLGLIVLLAGFLILQTLELRRTTRERDRADRERDRTARVIDFMTDIFKISDPSEARGNTVTAREILDKASNDIQKGLARDPEVSSQMMHAMANTYLNLGLYGRAHELAKQALDARSSLLGINDPKTLSSMSLLGWILTRERHDVEAEKIDRQALEAESRMLAPGDALTLETMDHLAVTVQHLGRYEEAVKLEREVVMSAVRSLGPENALTLQAMNHLGIVLLLQGNYSEAATMFRRLLDIERRVLGTDHPETLKALDNLAAVLIDEDRAAEAEPLLREALAVQQRVLGPEHQNTASAMQNLASMLVEERRLEEGEKLTREALKIRQRTLGPEHWDTLNSEFNLGAALYAEGRFGDAEILQRQTLASRIRVLGPKNPSTLLTQSTLAETLIQEGQYVEAEKLARDAFESQIKSLGPWHRSTLHALKQLGKVLARTKRYPEASQLFREVIEKQSGAAGHEHPWQVWYGFACVAAAANRSDDAVTFLKEAVNHGFRDGVGMAADSDLQSLRDVADFRQIVSQLTPPSAVNSVRSASGAFSRRE
jgi:eukaryotic-like serine/threonine-protein kinase